MLNKPISPFVWCNAVLKCLSTEQSNFQASELCPLQRPGTPLAWPDCENKLQMTKCNYNFKSRNRSRHNKPQHGQLACHNSWVWNSTVKAFTESSISSTGHSCGMSRVWKAADKLLLITSLQVVELIEKIFIPTPKQLSLCHATPNNAKQCQCQLGLEKHELWYQGTGGSAGKVWGPRVHSASL